ncbi:MAG TPA: hypothetical protein VMR37_06060, partial [Rhabdochlamydiaceae bacterium]|nr:hypothetical protein [Rhabdochlamydiaceae bacterium]
VQAAASVFVPSSVRTFYRVDKNSDKQEDLRTIFERILVPLYGSQEKALRQIADGTARACFLLYENNIPAGVIVYKTILSDEFKEYKIQNSIEIKSLFVVNSEKNSGRGLGSELLNKIIAEVRKLALKPESFHVTVSATKSESLNFFMSKKFRIRYHWVGRYSAAPTMVEYLLSCPLKDLDPEAPASPSIPRTIDTPAQPIQPTVLPHPHALRCIKDAHWGDIHVLKRLLSDRTFITGSKDNSLVKWTEEGVKICDISEVELTESDERGWITAACVINDEYWVSGERNGRITLWTTAGDYVRSLQPKMPKTEHVSHQFNQRRIMCLSPSVNSHKPGFFIGFPTIFDEFNLIEGRTASSTIVHNNDWVYCIHPLTKDCILTATAGTLEVWDRHQKEWRRGKTLLQETQKVYGQRPFISCLTPLQSSSHLMGLAIFGGAVKVFDLQKQQVVQQWKEHTNRIWALENVSPDLFATGGEDRSIKFWDSRSAHSVRTIPGHVGDVTVLMKLSDHQIVAGSCPPDINKTNESKHLSTTVRTNEGAQLLFYEMRK